MLIAVINSGSSSVKFQLFSMDDTKVLAQVLVEQIGEFSSHTSLKYQEKTFNITSVIKNHKSALEQIVLLLEEHEILKNFTSLDVIGHRVVHGGEAFHNATLIDEEVIKKIKSLIPLAPLHNKANLEGIYVTRKLAPKVPQVAVFDTSFHAKMPKEAFVYALDYELYEKHHIRRYGFHGSSHAYVLQESAKILQKGLDELNLITLHLGNGASACAIQNGVSIDTSMGFTPLEGLVMGSRSGDIDPAIVLYMQRELGMSVDEVDTALNKHSGLVGLCGENDLRAIIKQDDERSQLAIEIMCRRIRKYIGAYMALLGRVDAIVFTGGIGENSKYIRAKVLKEFPFGIELDSSLNEHNSTSISTPSSSVQVLVVKTDEELYIAKECIAELAKL